MLKLVDVAVRQLFCRASLLGGLLALACLACPLSIATAQQNPVHDLLPPAADSEDGGITVENEFVVIRGSDRDDKIRMEIRDDRIRFEINGNRFTLREDDYPVTPTITGPIQLFPAIVVAGYDGNDDIVIVDDTDEVPEELGTTEILILGGRGNDRIVSDSMIDCLLCGGGGSDMIVGGFGETMMSGGVMSTPSLNTSVLAAFYPDFEKDFLYSGPNLTVMASQWYMRIEPTEAPSNVYQVVDNQHLEPLRMGTIASREKGPVNVIPKVVFEEIRIEMDYVRVKSNTVNFALVVDQSMEVVEAFIIE